MAIAIKFCQCGMPISEQDAQQCFTCIRKNQELIDSIDTSKLCIENLGENRQMYEIKVGDVLKTKDGRDVRIVCTDTNTRGQCSIVGLVLCDDYEDVCVWYSDGKTSKYDAGPLDLILPNPKTKRIAPYISNRGGKWALMPTKLNSGFLDIQGIEWVTKEECASCDIWLEHLAVEVPDDVQD